MDRIKAEATIEAEAEANMDAEEAEVEVAMARVPTNLAKTRTLNSSNKTCLNSNNMAITNQWATNSKRWVCNKPFLLVSSQLSSRTTRCSRIQWLSNSRWTWDSNFQSSLRHRSRCWRCHKLTLASLISFKVMQEEPLLEITFTRPSKEYSAMNSLQLSLVLSLMKTSLTSSGSCPTTSTSPVECTRLISFWSLQSIKDKLRNSRPSNEMICSSLKVSHLEADLAKWCKQITFRSGVMVTSSKTLNNEWF